MACQCQWKVKDLLKGRIFSWLLFKQRLVTHAYQKKWQPDAPADCIMCDRNTEDVPHLFFNCAFALRLWRTSRSQGWMSHQVRVSGVPLGDSEVLVRVWVVLWAIWLHRNECIFKGREVSLSGVLHEVEGLLAIWASGR